MNNFFDNQRILNLIWKRKFHFIVVGVIAVILSAIFSGSAFITPMFKSTARVYPTSNVAEFSEESRTEQMLEIINSRDIKLKMFDAFNLSSVYKINKEDPLHLTYMFDTYGTNVNASKTEFETVEIKVLDEDPLRASSMCDSIIHFYNKKVSELHSLKHYEVIGLNEQYLQTKEEQLDSIQQLYHQIRKETGIISYDQLPYITEGQMLSLSENRGNTIDGKKISAQLEQFKERGLDAYRLEKKFYRLNNTVDSLKVVIEVELLEATKNITFSHIVESPIAADKKSYPVRWLIVAFSTLSAIFFSLLVFLVLDYRIER